MKLKSAWKNPFYIVTVLIVLIISLANSASKEQISTLSPIPIQTPNVDTFLVRKVIDGDTIELENGQKVRYIGMDTPENTSRKECFGAESMQKNKELVEGKQVRLEKDVSETDKYGRWLRYVYVQTTSDLSELESDVDTANEVFVNDFLVREGYANASTYPPDIKYQDKLNTAQKEAREQRKGFWGKCSVQGASNTGDLDCSDFKTQKEAQDFFISQGGPEKDPHNLDTNRDGKVCESLP